MTVLIAIPVYIIIALIMTKRATLIIGLTDDWAARRKTRMLITTALALGSIALGVAGIILGSQGQESGGWFLLLPLGVVLLIGTAIYGQYACRLVWPQRITDQYVWLKGVHADFLNLLPEWPYGIV